MCSVLHPSAATAAAAHVDSSAAAHFNASASPWLKAAFGATRCGAPSACLGSHIYILLLLLRSPRALQPPHGPLHGKQAAALQRLGLGLEHNLQDGPLSKQV